MHNHNLHKKKIFVYKEKKKKKMTSETIMSTKQHKMQILSKK